MSRDPYTLVVAADSSGAAEGQLYLDAGDGYGYQKGEYHLRRYSLSGGKMSSVAIHTSDAYVPANWLERVEIVGVAAPARMVLTAGGETRELAFSYSATTNRLVVRKPAVPMAADWSIELIA